MIDDGQTQLSDDARRIEAQTASLPTDSWAEFAWAEFAWAAYSK